MTPPGLRPDDIEAVRQSVRRYAASEGISYPEVARRAGLRPDDLKNFIYGRSSAEGIVAYLVARLPLNLTYEPARISVGKIV
jgi:hypothetical protein